MIVMPRLTARSNSDRLLMEILRELRAQNGKDPDPNTDAEVTGIQEPVEQPKTRKPRKKKAAAESESGDNG